MAYSALERSLRLLQRYPLPFVVWVGPVKDMLRWECVFNGPEGSPYEDGVFKFSMNFPEEFPHKPPQVVFKTKIYHPNVTEAGYVKLGVLHPPQWNPAFTVVDIVEAVWNMMTTPDLEEDRYVVADIRADYLNQNEVFMWIARSMTETHASLFD